MSGNFSLSISGIGIKTEAGAFKSFYSARRIRLRVFVVIFLAGLIVIDKKLRCLLKISAGLYRPIKES